MAEYDASRMDFLSDEQLENAQSLGAATYLSAYVRRMARELGVDDSDKNAMNLMAVEMVESVNLGTEAAWRALMNDRPGMNDALDRLRKTLENL